jgi:ABC-2 type transport system permease protein
MVLSIFMVPLGKLILFNQLDLSTLDIVKFSLIFVTVNLFFGCFAVWISSWAKGSARFSEVWRRVANPLWIYGGYQFSWYILYKVFPRLALVNLLNPITYTFEGMRAAILGQAGFIPFVVSFLMLWLFIAVFMYWALVWLKKRLDYV